MLKGLRWFLAEQRGEAGPMRKTTALLVVAAAEGSILQPCT